MTEFQKPTEQSTVELRAYVVEKITEIDEADTLDEAFRILDEVEKKVGRSGASFHFSVLELEKKFPPIPQKNAGA